MEPLTIAPSEHVNHIKLKYADLTVDQLRDKRKEISGNKKPRADVARTAFDLGMEISEGAFKGMQAIYPKYVQKVGYEIREVKRTRQTDDGIEEYIVNMYKIEVPMDNVFIGVDVTEHDALKYLADAEEGDEGLTPEELIVKYQVSQNLFFTKEAMKSVAIAARTVAYRRAKVLAAMHTITLQTIDEMVAMKDEFDQRARAQRMSAWLTDEGRKKLFGF